MTRFVDLVLIAPDGTTLDAWSLIPDHTVRQVIGDRPDARYVEVLHQGQLVDVYATGAPDRLREQQLRDRAAEAATPDRNVGDIDYRQRNHRSSWWLDRELAS